jgi:hypothetical protein
MLNKNNERVYKLDGDKPVELMTDAERDSYFLSLFNMTYDEFLETYKDDTTEDIMRDTFSCAEYV